MGNHLCGPSFCSTRPLRHVVEKMAFHPPHGPVSCSRADILDVLEVPEYGQVPLIHFQSFPRDEHRRRLDADVAESSHVEEGSMVILFSHGNACDVGEVEYTMQLLCDRLGVDVIGYDYPGYGGNDERPSEAGAFAAARAAFEYTVDKVAKSPENVVVFGHSLGTGPATQLAIDYKCGGLVLQSPLRSAMRVASPTLFVTLGMDIMANEDKIKDLPEVLPLYIIHGKSDGVISVEHGKVLAEFAHERMTNITTWWVPGKGHNDLESHPGYYINFGQFLSKL